MTLENLLKQIADSPESLEFADVMAVIDKHYHYQPSRFTNGLSDNAVLNEAGTNEGSCKIFAFGQLNGLSPQDTLACFGRFYREDVLQNPNGDDHQNIRNFMRDGWAGIVFDQVALTVS